MRDGEGETRRDGVLTIDRGGIWGEIREGVKGGRRGDWG
jgi:hypothetical protein